MTQIQRGSSLPCKSTCRRQTRTWRLRRATSTSWSTSPTLTGGLWATATGMALKTSIPSQQWTCLTNSYLLLRCQGHRLCTQHVRGRKKWRRFWKISVSLTSWMLLWLRIFDNGLHPLIESFVVCHRWYSKNMNRMKAQGLLMKEVKSKHL